MSKLNHPRDRGESHLGIFFAVSGIILAILIFFYIVPYVSVAVDLQQKDKATCSRHVVKFTVLDIPNSAGLSQSFLGTPTPNMTFTVTEFDGSYIKRGPIGDAFAKVCSENEYSLGVPGQFVISVSPSEGNGAA